MTRGQLEHIIRASGSIVGAGEVVIIGSQAVLAQHPDAQGLLVESMEADVFTFRDPSDAEVIDGAIGETSPFHRTFGYFAHGVGVETAVLSDGWRDRLVRLNTPSTNGVTGLCLEAHDLAAAKLCAGRDKDVDFVSEMLRQGLIDAATVARRLEQTPTDPVRRGHAMHRLTRAKALAAGARS
jgi:hypothetical protein